MVFQIATIKKESRNDICLLCNESLFDELADFCPISKILPLESKLNVRCKERLKMSRKIHLHT